MRFLLIAALALTACGGAVESRADGYVRAHHTKKRFYSYRAPHSSFFPFGVGGHLFGWQNTPYIYHTQGYSNSPQFDNQTFWERVQTQSDYPIR